MDISYNYLKPQTKYLKTFYWAAQKNHGQNKEWRKWSKSWSGLSGFTAM